MKFFDVMPERVEEELHKRGVLTDKLLYCVKADMDGDGMRSRFRMGYRGVADA